MAPSPMLKIKIPRKAILLGPYRSRIGPTATDSNPPQMEPKAIAPVIEARVHPNSCTIGFMNMDKTF